VPTGFPTVNVIYIKPPTHTRQRSPNSGRNTSHARHRMVKKTAVPHTNAKRRAANITIPPRSHPTNGIQLRRAMIGENSKKWPKTMKNQAANLMIDVLVELLDRSSLKIYLDFTDPSLIS